jgi:long-chain acyl-CoA synthetase
MHEPAKRRTTMHLAALPDERAAQSPTALCLTDDAETLDNASFLSRVEQATAVLRRQGVTRDSVVAVVLPNRTELVVTLFAAWRLGAAVTPVNPALTADEAAFQVRDAGARVVVSVTDDELGGVRLRPEDLRAEQAEPLPPASTDPSGLALLIYTSGTTGRPKGVMLDHANVSAMCTMAVAALEVTDTDHSLVILPLFHVNGIVAGTMTPLLAGGRVTLAGRFSPAAFLEQVASVRPTYFSAVPAIYALLSTMPEDTAVDMSSLRVAVCGAAPMPAELIARFEQRFGVPLVEGYGLSEGTCASTINPLRGRRKPGTVGLPFPGQEVEIVDASGAPVPNGERGEVVLRGPNVMRGYLNRPDETASTIRDGWLHTGDVGHFDADGYLVLVDRIKDMIIRGGENIYPKEIENVLHAHDDVVEAAVVGRPDDVLGEVVVAYAALRPGATATSDDLLRHCAASLAKYKHPVELHLLAALPKNPIGKIDKPALRTGLGTPVPA